MISPSSKKLYAFSIALVFSSLVSLGLCSVGDRLPEFRACVHQCTLTECTDKIANGGGSDSSGSQLPLSLRLTFWTCPQNCDYLCQRSITQQRLELGQSVEQFHGKWPFLRIMGVQEPLSVVFSVLNFIPHFLGFKMLIQFLNKTYGVKASSSSSKSTKVPAVLKTLIYTYMGIAITGMNAWIWSSVFHVRDFVVTERLDYFSAGLTVLYGFYACTVRVFGLYNSSSSSNQRLRWVLAILCAAAYASHVYYLQFVRFDYGYNMLANVVVGLFQNGLWVYLAISEYNKSGNSVKTTSPAQETSEKQSKSATTKTQKQQWRLMPLYLVISVSLAMSFELFDFPPLWDVLDAHALWHAGTILPTFIWYVWMEKDLLSFVNSKEE